MSKPRIVHYINQFYAGLGGEDKAHTPPEARDGHIGPGMALNAALGGAGEVVGTVFCGDDYFNENLEAAGAAVLEMIKGYNPDIVVVGPGFNAGRYGMACGMVAKIVDEELSVPVVGGLFEENPGLMMYKRHGYFVPTGNSAATMRKAMPDIAGIVKQLIAGSIPTEGFFEKGLRQNYFAAERGSRRAVQMLLNKIAGSAFVTEYPMPVFDRVEPAAAIADMSKARIALVSSGGPVPKHNPDRIESSSASKYGKYSLANIDTFTPENGETAHGGYDPVYANADLNRVLPVDVVKELVKSGEIGSLHEFWYSTVGNGTSVANSKKFAGDIAKDLLADNVSCVILTSTWGTCTRCGATMVKEIESHGIAVVHMCTVVPISVTVGANRIVPTVAIPYPLGDPALPPDEERALRMQLVKKALAALGSSIAEQTVF